MQKLIRIDPQEAPKFVHNVLDNILDTLKSQDSDFTAKPACQQFKLMVEGKCGDKQFVVKHTIPTKHGSREQLYIAFGEYEFVSDFSDLSMGDFLSKVDACIKKKYIYDLNSGTYALRPVEMTVYEDIKQWIRSKFGKQKTK